MIVSDLAINYESDLAAWETHVEQTALCYIMTGNEKGGPSGVTDRDHVLNFQQVMPASGHPVADQPSLVLPVLVYEKDSETFKDTHTSFSYSKNKAQVQRAKQLSLGQKVAEDKVASDTDDETPILEKANRMA